MGSAGSLAAVAAGGGPGWGGLALVKVGPQHRREPQIGPQVIGEQQAVGGQVGQGQLSLRDMLIGGENGFNSLTVVVDAAAPPSESGYPVRLPMVIR